MHNVLVITVEGLPTGLISAYGSNVGSTPTLDGLAAQGLVLDQCFLDSRELTSQMHSLWTGHHHMQAIDSQESLWRFAKQSGLPSMLITDCELVAREAEQHGCESVSLVDPPSNDEACHDVTECESMRLFAAAADDLSGGRQGIVWIHSRGLRLAWDAPLELRERLLDPEDPPPPSEAIAPSFTVDAQTDPDLVIGWGQVAAAQVAIIDHAIAAILETLATRGDADLWSVAFVSLGGVPLGEHGFLGWGKQQFHGEELSCASIIVPCPAMPIGVRRAQLCQLPDLGVTLFNCVQLASGSGEPVSKRPDIWGRCVLELPASATTKDWAPANMLAMINASGAARNADARWIRTPAWSAVLDDSDNDLLYVKPDDRWEVCNVANRCSDALEQLRDCVRNFESALAHNDRGSLAAIDSQLYKLIR